MPVKLLPAPRIQNAIYTSEVSRYMILEERIHFLVVMLIAKITYFLVDKFEANLNPNPNPLFTVLISRTIPTTSRQNILSLSDFIPSLSDLITRDKRRIFEKTSLNVMVVETNCLSQPNFHSFLCRPFK